MNEPLIQPPNAHRVVHHAAGDVLFKQGDLGSEVYLVVSGHVQISQEIDGAEQVLATLDPGQFFGEMALFEGAVRSASATVHGHARLICFTKEEFLERAHEEPAFALALVQDLCARLRGATDMIHELVHEEEVLQEQLARVLTKFNVLIKTGKRI